MIQGRVCVLRPGPAAKMIKRVQNSLGNKMEYEATTGLPRLLK